MPPEEEIELPDSKRVLAFEIPGRKARGTLVRLLSYLKPHWKHVIAVAATMVAATAFDLVQPYIIGFLIFGLVITEGRIDLLPWFLLLFALALVAKQIVSFLRGILTEILSQKTAHKLRYDLYYHIERLPVRFFDENRSGELVSRVMSDTDEVEKVMTTGISSIGADIITLIGALALLFYVNQGLALMVTPVILGLGLTVNVFKQTLKRFSRRVREAVGELAAKANETVSGIRTVKSFSMEDREAEHFQKSSLSILRGRVKLARLSWFYTSTVDLTTGAAILLVLAVAAPVALSGNLSLGSLVAFLGYVDRLFKPMVGLSKANLNIQKAVAAGERIFQIMDTTPEDKQPGGIEPQAIKGLIRYDDVSFGYTPGQMVLRDFNLTIQPGETVAIVGRSGVGKTTLVNLLLRFYEPTSGRVLIDGESLTQWTLATIRQRIGIVFQEPFLFSGTVRDNIAYGNIKATEAEIIEAAKAANAHDFIIGLPEGYNTQIGERGVKLSAGQRQRIAIGRALLRNPAILILDEATSNVDSESEVLIQDALRRAARGRTTIIIAHRLSTIVNANRIVVIEAGETPEIGSHEELLEKGGTYTRLYQSQLSETLQR